MDVDVTEIQIRVKQADGSYVEQWLPMSELVKLMKQSALDAFQAVIASRLNQRPSPSEATPQTQQQPPE